MKKPITKDRVRRTGPTAAAAAILGGLVTVSCLQPADEIIGRSGARGIVFVKEASIGDNNIAMASNEFHPGSDLYLLSPISPSGTLTNLTEKWTRASASERNWGAAQDPEVSHDGKRILFSMREARTGNANRAWQIYELDLESGRLHTLTSPPLGASVGNGYIGDIDPVYVDDGHIIFGSTRNQIIDEYERRQVPQLFIGERSGPGEALKNIRQITFNQSHDQNPMVHSSGKVYFSRWDHLGSPNKIPLFTINPDGTGQFVLYGADETFSGTSLSSGSRTFLEARELADGGLVTSMMDRASDFEGGGIGIIDLSRFTSPPEIITPETSPYNTTRNPSQALFKTPYPIMDGGRERILVAQSPREAGGDIRNPSVNYDLFVMDKDGGNMRVVHSDPYHNDYDPVVVEPRALPAKAYEPNALVHAALTRGDSTGVFLTADIYSRMDNDGHMKPSRDHLNRDGSRGQGRYVRFLEAVSMPSSGGMRGATVGRTEFEKQRVIGYGDIRPDGSFSVEVPANTPLHLQVLDENGLMLVNQLQWINVMPGERRICTGCHGPRERDADIQHMRIADDRLVFDLDSTRKFMATFANAQKVKAHPAARADTVDFVRLDDPDRAGTVQAVLDARCVSCHGASNASSSGGGLVLEHVGADTSMDRDPVSNVYANLTRDGGYRTTRTEGNNTRIPYVNDDGARQSPLAWVLFDKYLGRGSENLYRKGSHDHSAMWGDSSGAVDPFATGNRDLLTLIEWMDMGIQFSNSVGR
jgi:hypothetical protein